VVHGCSPLNNPPAEVVSAVDRSALGVAAERELPCTTVLLPQAADPTTSITLRMTTAWLCTLARNCMKDLRLALHGRSLERRTNRVFPYDYEPK
jgi:hypothetical protein